MPLKCLAFLQQADLNASIKKSKPRLSDDRLNTTATSIKFGENQQMEPSNKTPLTELKQSPTLVSFITVYFLSYFNHIEYPIFCS